jgi:hypothetical protein
MHGQAQPGNQPPDTNPAQCVACSPDEKACYKDSDCCDNTLTGSDRSFCLSTNKCGPRYAIGETCSDNKDCQTLTCVVGPSGGVCEPSACDCTGNTDTTCTSGYTCYQSMCVESITAQGNDCSVSEGSPPPPPPVCGDQECTGCVPDCSGEYTWDPELCSCVIATSPIIIDTDGKGFQLTSAGAGVLFDFFGTGKPIQIAWTAPGSTNGWLALDRNGNGVIDSAKELFGNVTPQPLSDDQNGFLALAVFDDPLNGGNGDGIIDRRDAVWPKLLVWIDANHDGVSQANELRHLDPIGILSIGLMYRESKREDQYGNEFRYKGSLNPGLNDKVNRVIYDVILANDIAGTPPN